MTSEGTTVLLIGATGYVGGTVLSRLLPRLEAANIQITVLLRSSEKAELLQALGVTTVIIPTDGIDQLRTLASLAHIVLSMDGADDIHTTQAILQGLKISHSTSGDVPILIHISDVAFLSDLSLCPNLVYDDMQPELIEAVSHNNAYSKVISTIVEADKQAYVKSHIVIPGLIYGIASGTVANAGIQETLSARISNLILAALDRGRLGMVGDGQAIWPNIHIDDVVDLILKIFDVQSSNSPIARSGCREYYFATNGEHRWYDLSKAIGDAFTHAGLARTSQVEPSSFSDEELTQYMGSVMGQQMRHNIKCRSNHGIQLGWRPIRTSEDMFASIPLQLDAIIKALLDKQQRPPGPM